MRIVKLSSLVLIGIMPWLLSCQDAGREPDRTTLLVPATYMAKSVDDHQDYLSGLWERSNEPEFEVAVTAVFKPEEGCDVTGVPESWADLFPDYSFALKIEPFALDPDEFGELTITISVPTLESIQFAFGTTQAMPIERTVDFEAVFDPPALFTFSFHPHLRPSCASYCFFGLGREVENPDIFFVSDPQMIDPRQVPDLKRLSDLPGEPFENLITRCATGLQVSVASFSDTTRPDRWQVVNGCCGRDGEPIETPCDWDE